MNTVDIILPRALKTFWSDSSWQMNEHNYRLDYDTAIEYIFNKYKGLTILQNISPYIQIASC